MPADIQAHITFLEHTRTQLDADLLELVEATPEMREKLEVLLSVAGMGPTTALPVPAPCQPRASRLADLPTCLGLAPCLEGRPGRRRGPLGAVLAKT